MKEKMRFRFIEQTPKQSSTHPDFPLSWTQVEVEAALEPLVNKHRVPRHLP